MEIRANTDFDPPINESGPHDFRRRDGWRNRNDCRHCYLPKKAHAVQGYTPSRPL